MSASQRRKGHTWERQVAALFRQFFPGTIRRGLQSRGGGAEAADVEGVDGIHVECKAVEKLNIWAAMQQAADDAQPHERPVVIARRNRHRPIVVMQLNDWLEWASALHPDLARSPNEVPEPTEEVRP